jgi:hypothetical protein
MDEVIETLKGVGQKLGFYAKFYVLTGILFSLARLKKTATYGEVADMIREFLGPKSQFFAGSQDLARMLGKRQNDDAAKGKPLLSALVVGQDTGIPGAGFFTQAASLDLLPDGATEGEQLVFWQKQRDACFALFAPPCGGDHIKKALDVQGRLRATLKALTQSPVDTMLHTALGNIIEEHAVVHAALGNCQRCSAEWAQLLAKSQT